MITGRSVAPAAAGNALLARLPVAYARRLVRGCEGVALPVGDVLSVVDARLRYAYFPLDGAISMTVRAGARRACEVGLVGREGMLGATLVLGSTAAPVAAIVQGAGVALRIPAAQLQAELLVRADLRVLLAHYCVVLMRQWAQAGACAAYHTLRARLARRLLMSLDRSSGAELALTQEILGTTLGVRRAGITEAASDLRAAGLVTYHRGSLQVVDRAGLAVLACGCYRADLDSYARGLGAGTRALSRRRKSGR